MLSLGFLCRTPNWLFNSGSNPTMCTEKVSSYRLHVDVFLPFFAEKSNFLKTRALHCIGGLLCICVKFQICIFILKRIICDRRKTRTCGEIVNAKQETEKINKS